MKRNTHQQQVMMDVLANLKGHHPTADQVYEQVAQAIPTISRATVYRILHQLVTEGGIQRVQIPTTADRYDDHLAQHYHVRCDQCGQIADLAVPALFDLCEHLQSTAGYAITGHNIVFTGLCENCRGSKI